MMILLILILISNAEAKPMVDTNIDIGWQDFANLVGVTSPIQAQLDSKVPFDTFSLHALDSTNPHSTTAAQLGGNNIVAEINARTGQLNWARVNKTGASLADIPTRSHTALTDVGANTHAQIDTAITNSVNHIADSTLHIGFKYLFAKFNCDSASTVTSRRGLTGTITVANVSGGGCSVTMQSGMWPGTPYCTSNFSGTTYGTNARFEPTSATAGKVYCATTSTTACDVWVQCFY